MTVYVHDPDFLLYQGDCLGVLRTLEPDSVHCCVTSPPYWGLRDYGTGSWEGGDPDCDHQRPTGGTGGDPARGPNLGRQPGADRTPMGDVCIYCGAERVDSQVGLEQTPQEYVQRLVEVFREVRRVLRPDGTLWLNLGDSYAGTGGRVGRNDAETKYKGLHQQQIQDGGRQRRPGALFTGGTATLDAQVGAGRAPGLKSKDLVGIPWRVAFALQDDGWYLRSDIIWAKANPMPESITDRPTKAHEYVFLLSKSGRYYYDQDAIAEQTSSPPGATWEERKAAGAIGNNRSPQNVELALAHGDGSAGSNLTRQDGKRNARSVWELTTQPYAAAHFATFPQELPRRCISAGTSEHGCCPDCGKPWHRMVRRGADPNYVALADRPPHGMTQPGNATVKTGSFGLGRPRQGVEWIAPCDHNRAPVPAVVLDPFMGAATTALVARNLGRASVGIELNPDYCAIAASRLGQQSLLTGVWP